MFDLKCDLPGRFIRQMQTAWDSNLLAIIIFELISKAYQFCAKVNFKKGPIILFRIAVNAKSSELENSTHYQNYYNIRNGNSLCRRRAFHYVHGKIQFVPLDIFSSSLSLYI